MSQFTLTPEEDAIVADALRAKAASYVAMFGSADASLEALIAKVEGQLPATVVAVVAEVAAVEPQVEQVPTPKSKKAKVEETPAEE